MELNNGVFFLLGVEAGRKQMMDHIQHQHSIEKPVEINGELYWLKDSREHLLDVMDALDSKYGIQKENQYIVPMHKVFDGKCTEFKVIIPAKTPYEAWCIAYAAFEYKEKEIVGGWKVYPNYGEYEQVE